MENTEEIKVIETSTEKRKSWKDLNKVEKRNIIMFSSIGAGLLSIVGICLGFGIPQLLPSAPQEGASFAEFKSGCYDSYGAVLKTGRECFSYQFVENSNCYAIKDIQAPSETETVILSELYQGENDTSTYMVKAIGFSDGDSSAFKGETSGIKSVYCNTIYLSLGAYSFSGLSALENVSFADTAREYKMTVNAHCFDGDANLKTVRLGNGLSKIKDSAFNGCSSLESIELSARLESIGANAFNGCTSLTSIQYKGTKENWDKLNKDENWAKGSSITTVYCNGLPITI
ncbi:MAG: leucine-rich repeat domain-containing protein [Bacilli bacterium]|nr:leucine-rich repeat domain-containing protein [Bacilli bacterium]